MNLEELLRRSDTGEGLALGELIAPSVGAARTDTVGTPDRAVNIYVSGSNLVLQVFSLELGAWKSVTLS